MIKSFANKRTEKIYNREFVKGMSNEIQDSALRKLKILNRARSLSDLQSLPGNRLEKLRGDRKGQYSIRINDQWRICFVWTEGDVQDVEIVDYH